MIKRVELLATVAATGICALSAAALAADIPVKAPPGAIAHISSSYYFWIDGSYQSVNLPTHSLGFQQLSPGTFLNQGPFETRKVRAEGWGIAGAAGYILPHGTLPGSNGRLEVGVSYVDADRSQSGLVAAAPGGRMLQNLAGVVALVENCFAGCGTRSTLTTDYNSWAVYLKGASDFRNGATTLTPSAQVFGGATRNRQALSQTIFQGTAGFPPLQFYSANSRVRWTDVGAKVGLDGKLDATSWLQLGLGGTVGIAARSTNLSANDACIDAPGGGLGCTNAGALAFSSISRSATTAAFLANAEASVTVAPSPSVRLRGFVGLNHDSKVPGIAAPTFTAPVIPAPGNQGTPAGIKYSSETSWYAGGGILVKFGP